MPATPTFNPNLPATGTTLSSQEMRDQFNALKGQVDEVQDIADTSAVNPTNLLPLSLDISDPPTQAQVEAIRDQLNALLGALYR